MRFTTKDDAVQQAILPALGEYADAHDIDAIFAEAFEYKADNTAGFEQVVDTDEFWEIAKKHAKS